MNRSSTKGYRFVEGDIATVVVAAHVIDFVLEGHHVTVEKTAATATLRSGERIRALLQDPFEDVFSHVIAFQKGGGGRVHYTGPSLTLHTTLMGAALLATGIYAGMASLLVFATSLFVLDWIVSAQKTEALRQFRAR